MRPVARVRSNAGARSPSGLGDARAAALRGRFEQLLHGSGDGLPTVSQTLLSHGAPPPPPPPAMQWTSAALAHGELHHFDETLRPVVAPDKLPQDTSLSSSPPMAAAAERSLLPHNTARPAAQATASDAVPAAAGPERAALTDTTRAALSDTTREAHNGTTPAAQSGTRRAADSADAAAVVLPPPQAALTTRTDVQAHPRQPATPLQAARGPRDSLPELMRDLVQAVVHMSRGREGRWRLTMALKPQVLAGTLVVLDAQPGRLRVRFDCAATQASTRLNAVRDHLQQRLTEALSAARCVDVSVEVHRLAPGGARDAV